MRVLISAYGSRGDVQPMVALAVVLRSLGVETTVCAPGDEEYAALVKRAGVPFLPAFCSVRDWVARAKLENFDLPRLAPIMVEEQYEVLAEAAAGCDALVATGLFPASAAAQAVAEKAGIRHVHVSFCPRYIPSPWHAPFEFPGWPNPPGETDNLALWRHNAQAMTGLFGDAVNAHRASIGLPNADDVRAIVFTRDPWLACDPELGPWRPTDILDVVQTGAWLLQDDRPLPADLTAFLNEGDAPVFVGFGSMPMAGAPDAAASAIAAARANGRRTVLLKGSAQLVAVDGGRDCLVIGEVNQQALFRRVAAVVHHGGAGTTTTAAAAGIPQVIVPQVADQPYWAGRCAELGIGVAHDGPIPTADSLEAAIGSALAPRLVDRAVATAGLIRLDGARRAAERLVSMLRSGS